VVEGHTTRREKGNELLAHLLVTIEAHLLKEMWQKEMLLSYSWWKGANETHKQHKGLLWHL